MMAEIPLYLKTLVNKIERVQSDTTGKDLLETVIDLKRGAP